MRLGKFVELLLEAALVSAQAFDPRLRFLQLGVEFLDPAAAGVLFGFAFLGKCRERLLLLIQFARQPCALLGGGGVRLGKFVELLLEAALVSAQAFDPRLRFLQLGVEFLDPAAAGVLFGFAFLGKCRERLLLLIQFARQPCALLGGGGVRLGKFVELLLEAALVAAQAFGPRLRLLQLAGALFAVLPGGAQGLR